MKIKSSNNQFEIRTMSKFEIFYCVIMCTVLMHKKGIN